MTPDVPNDIRPLFEVLGHDLATPDRVTAVIVGAYADKYLGLRLWELFVGADAGLKDKLLRPAGVIGPFSVRVDLLKALGEIGPITHADLKTIGSIRNEFAHNLNIERFDHPEIIKLVKKLKTLEFVRSTSKHNEPPAIPSFYNALSLKQVFCINGGLICLALSERYDPTTVSEAF